VRYNLISKDTPIRAYGFYIVDYADLAILDLSKATTLEGRRELAGELVKAMHDKGFFYVINHGYTQAQVPTLLSFSCTNS
jgi:isopenicillin N synthase-like dioxygenase